MGSTHSIVSDMAARRLSQVIDMSKMTSRCLAAVDPYAQIPNYHNNANDIGLLRKSLVMTANMIIAYDKPYISDDLINLLGAMFVLNADIKLLENGPSTPPVSSPLLASKSIRFMAINSANPRTTQVEKHGNVTRTTQVEQLGNVIRTSHAELRGQLLSFRLENVTTFEVVTDESEKEVEKEMFDKDVAAQQKFAIRQRVPLRRPPVFKRQHYTIQQPRPGF